MSFDKLAFNILQKNVKEMISEVLRVNIEKLHISDTLH